MVKKFVRNLFHVIINNRPQKSINIVKTVYINFKTQKFKDAIKFPIIIRGKCTLIGVKKTSIVLKSIKPGVVRIGHNEGFSNEKCGVRFRIGGGQIIFEGSAAIFIDATIESYGRLTIGNNVIIGSSVKIFCHNNIEIGQNSRIVVESQVFDTNFHYVRNLDNGIVKKRWGEIKIGRNVWIGNRCTVMMGSNIPAYSIVAGNSVVNKNLEEFGKGCLFAGTPAEFKTRGYTRIFDIHKELELDGLFRQEDMTTIDSGVRGYNFD